MQCGVGQAQVGCLGAVRCVGIGRWEGRGYGSKAWGRRVGAGSVARFRADESDLEEGKRQL